MEQLSRRLFLQVASATSLTALAPKTLQADTRNKILPLVIFFQGGAQSPYEFVSPLVDSSKEIRGDGDIITASNGIPIDARWTEFAKIANKTAVVRSLHSGNVNHDAQPVVGQPGTLGDKMASGGIPHSLIELPSTFSDISKLKRNLGMDIRWNEDQKRFVPPEIATDERLEMRLKLLEKIDQPMPGHTAQRMHANRELAASLLTGGGGALKTPFEKATKERERYGNHPIGDACALASALAQSGAGVTLVYNEFGRGWDLHNNMQEGYDQIIPPTDKALAELIMDARRHNFAVLMTSEHGRTPKINSSGGRDHFTTDYAVMAGGNIREDAVIGRVAKDGGIRDDEIKGDKLMATMLQACGLKAENPTLVESRLLN